MIMSLRDSSGLITEPVEGTHESLLLQASSWIATGSCAPVVLKVQFQLLSTFDAVIPTMTGSHLDGKTAGSDEHRERHEATWKGDGGFHCNIDVAKRNDPGSEMIFGLDSL
ncbi:hypothetical protein DPM19_34465 [Actinomadura craniellae]|uniref:Uncharacterized protein n=1 Tax=Actinomadura craniellae TaxID=2231787 RepID=A0A365GV51_9ACTN|nr:hypothetical protein DPM19_34465 [Actinomadura craniellae]